MLYVRTFLTRHFAVRFCAAFCPADASLILAGLGRLAASELAAGGATADTFPLQGLPFIDPGRRHLGLGLIQTDYRYKCKKSHHLFHVFQVV